MERNKKAWCTHMEKKQPIETAQVLDLLNKKFKPASLNMFKEVKENTSKEFKEDRRTMAHQ